MAQQPAAEEKAQAKPKVDKGKMMWIRSLYKHADDDESNTLSMKEFNEILDKFGISEDDKGPFKKLIDADDSGEISLEEFVGVITEHLEAMQKNLNHMEWVSSIYDTFQSYDENGDGKIEYKEWEKVFADNDMKDQAKKMWDEAIKNDQNNDGKLNFAEFWKYINSFS